MAHRLFARSAGAKGEFTLRLPAPGRYDLKVLRIGYRPTQGPSVTVADGATETVRIVFAAEAVVLSAMNVRERETCRVNADSGFMVARVWEEARKAMLTSQLSADGAPLFAEWIEYDRRLDSGGACCPTAACAHVAKPHDARISEPPAGGARHRGVCRRRQWCDKLISFRMPRCCCLRSLRRDIASSSRTRRMGRAA